MSLATKRLIFMTDVHMATTFALRVPWFATSL
jgi:hypothetical protein